MFKQKNRLRIWISMLLIVQLVASSAAWGSGTVWAENEMTTEEKLDALIRAGIFDKEGSPNNSNSNIPTTREELAIIMARLNGLQVAAGTSYTDVAADRWSAGFIQAVTNAGLMEGPGDGKFDPSGEITLEQLATVAVRALGLKPESNATVDGDVSEWAKGYVAAAIANGLLSDEPDFTRPAIRSELVEASYAAKESLNCSNEPNLQLSESSLDLGVKNGELKLTFTTAINEASIELDQFHVSGLPLQPVRDRFSLSEDGKTLTVTLGEGYVWDAKQADPSIKLGAIQSVCKRELEKASQTVPLKVVNPPQATIPAYVPEPSDSPSVSMPSIRINSSETVTFDVYADIAIDSADTSKIYYMVLHSDGPVPGVADLISETPLSSYAYDKGSITVTGTSMKIRADVPISNLKFYAVGESSSGYSSVVSHDLDSTKLPVINDLIVISHTADQTVFEIDYTPSVPVKLYYVISIQPLWPDSPEEIRDFAIGSDADFPIEKYGTAYLDGSTKQFTVLGLNSSGYVGHIVLEYNGILIMKDSGGFGIPL